MRKLITARARKNKRTARMLANARKLHSIPLFRATERKSDGGKLNRAIPELCAVAYSKWRESCAAKRLRKLNQSKENIAQFHPKGPLKSQNVL